MCAKKVCCVAKVDSFYSTFCLHLYSVICVLSQVITDVYDKILVTPIGTGLRDIIEPSTVYLS